MKVDEWGTVFNCPENFNAIAQTIIDYPVFIAWTDGNSTQYDILFTMVNRFNIIGPVQRGLWDAELFVSIMGKGAFGFDMSSRGKHPSYIAEKLHLDNSSTTEKVAELINGVIEYLNGKDKA